jgi:hypothetical protein|tara:strand:+ start:119 stop:403 length:285 start_codon:yes stop_codon:yes gene_type:complete
LIIANGFDKAFIGTAHRVGCLRIAVYDLAKCIKVLVDRDGMTETEAEEFMFFNVVDAYVGPSSPVFIERFGTIEEAVEDMEETDIVDYQQQTVT